MASRVRLLKTNRNPVAESYIRSRKIRRLFKSLTVGLLHNQPANEIKFLINCLDIVEKIGWENVSLKTFVNIDAVTMLPASETQPNAPAAKVANANVTDDSLESSREKWKRVINGSLNESELPEVPSNIVRVFISSTFSDFKAERNELLCSAFPTLQRFCYDYGLEFQVVDLRWGVTDEMMNDHQVSELCIREIALCQKISVGPNFVALIGDRYGFQPIPSLISEAELDVLLSFVDDADRRSVLNEWYVKDENIDPVYYVLQPIASKLPHYYSKEEKHAAEQQKWDEISAIIQQTLRTAVQKAVNERLIDEKSANRYFISVTEDEVRHGLQGADASSVLCCIRTLQDIRNGKNKSAMSKFTDLRPSYEFDSDSQSKLNNLKLHLSETFPTKSIRQYTTQWNDCPLEDEPDAHGAYLRQFSDDFVESMKYMIEAGLANRKAISSEFDQHLLLEVLHHAQLALAKSKVFCGREDVLEKIRSYFFHVNTETERQPLVLFGTSGQGKTAVMAAAARQTVNWFAACGATRPIVALRFFGTTPMSSDIFSALQSVTAQVSLAFGFPNPEPAKQMSDVRRAFWDVLSRVEKERGDSALVIYLDSIDQLEQYSYGCQQMAWLPKKLPVNVHLVLSVLSPAESGELFQNIQSRLNQSASFIELEPVSAESTDQITTTFLNNCKRKVTDSQMQQIRELFATCRQLLFVKLILDHAVTWSSTKMVDYNVLPRDINQAIYHLFDTTEKKYGQVFISHAFAYLTCSVGGITELEMEDVLSCDDDVLNEVYRYHDPPLENSIRIPGLMWPRVREELREYLSERQVRGKNTVSWYHRQFLEAATNRYLASPDQTIQFHNALAELFRQENGIRRTVTLRCRRNKVIENADRKVAPQPLDPSNLRKLRCLPYHLFNSNAISELKELCLVNFKWLLVWLTALGATSALNIFRHFNETTNQLQTDTDVETIWNLLQICYDSLRYDAKLLAYHIVERLESTSAESALIKQLVRDAKDYIKTFKLPQLLPTHSLMFDDISGPLQWTVMAGQTGVVTRDGTKIACMWKDPTTSEFRIRVLNLVTLEILTELKVAKDSPLALTADGRYFAYITSSSVKLCEADNGDTYSDLSHGGEGYQEVTPRCIAVSHCGKYLAIGVRIRGQAKSDCSQTSSLLALYDLQTSMKQPISEMLEPGKKAVNSLLFTKGDMKLVAIFNSTFLVLEIPQLKVVHRFGKGEAKESAAHDPHFTSYVQLYADSKLMMCVIVQNGVKVALFDAADSSLKWSATMKGSDTAGEDRRALQLVPFGIVSPLQDDGTVLIGTRTQLILKHIKSSMKAQRFNAAEESKKIQVVRGNLWQWSMKTNELTNIDICKQSFWETPTSLLMLDSVIKNHVIVGWNNGDLSLVDLDNQSTVWKMHAHGKAVDTIMMCSHLQNGKNSILTLAADNCIKMWRVSRLLSHTMESVERSQQRQNVPAGSVKPLATNSVSEDDRDEQMDQEYSQQQTDNRGETMQSGRIEPHEGGSKPNVISPTEQCIDISVFGDYLLTAPPFNTQGPKFWHLSSGEFANEMTSAFDESFKKSSALHGIDIPYRSHAQLLCVNDFLIYMRKKATEITVCVTRVVHNQVTVIAHKCFPLAYLTLIVHQKTSREAEPFVIYVVRNTTVESLNGRLESLGSIEIPALAIEIPSLESELTNAGKRKLLSYHVALSVDNKYLVIVNPTPVQGCGKYMDVVDLESKRYVKRKLFPRLPWKVFDGNVYFLSQSVEEEFDLVSVRQLSENRDYYSQCRYMYLVKAENQILSPDEIYGVELPANSHDIHVWCISGAVSRPPTLVATLSGHVADVTSTSWLLGSVSVVGGTGKTERDKIGLLVSGSTDCTVRVWSIDAGSQLCLFHVYGAVDSVRFSDVVGAVGDGSSREGGGDADQLGAGAFRRHYIAVHCSSAPFRKRAVILRLSNVHVTNPNSLANTESDNDHKYRTI